MELTVCMEEDVLGNCLATCKFPDDEEECIAAAAAAIPAAEWIREFCGDTESYKRFKKLA